MSGPEGNRARSRHRSAEAICPACGTRNRAAATFCIGCVGPLAGARAPAAEAPTILCTRREAAGEGDRPWPNDLARQALPEGTTTEGFQILRPLGEGGFGIVYLAWDPVLERHVALKEYMPSTLALRGENSLGVSMRSERHRSTFEAGLKSFLNEARLLARFDHPALLKVFRFWEAHGTAYMAMPYYEGPTLKEVLAGESSAPSEAQLREWLHPLLDALAVIHRENCLHRDISPDNILLTNSGPVLLDFGAARRVISDMTQSMTAVLKPGFAPIEQYGGVMNQGPWTDLYALAGVVYYAITGQLPPASAARVVSDSFRPLGDAYAGRYSDRFLHAIDAALSLRPEARPQDVAQFRALIDPLPAGGPPAAFASAPAPEPPPPEVDLEPTSGRTAQSLVAEADTSLAVSSATPSAHAALPPRSRKSHRLPLVLALALACSTAWWLGTRPTPAPTEARALAAPPAQPATAVQTPPIAAVQASPPDASPPTPAEAPKPAAPAAAKPAPVAAARPRARAEPAASAPAPSESRPRAAARVEVAPMPTLSAANRAQRCSDLVLKSSLESLSADEVSFQKNQCK